jgi:hypothetical protein
MTEATGASGAGGLKRTSVEQAGTDRRRTQELRQVRRRIQERAAQALRARRPKRP